MSKPNIQKAPDKGNAPPQSGGCKVIRRCATCKWATKSYWLEKKGYFPEKQQFIQCDCQAPVDMPSCFSRTPMKIAYNDEGKILKTPTGEYCPTYEEKE